MKNKTIPAIILMLFIFSSCEVLEEVQQTLSFTKCSFRLHSIENLHFAGVNIQNKESLSDLSFSEAAKISAAIAGQRYPVDFDLNIQVKNPNERKATMNRLEWQLFVDDIQLLQGNVNRRIDVPSNGGIRTFPLHISTDMNELLNENTKEAVKNLIFNLAGAGNQPSNIMLKAKPSIEVNGVNLDYPGYIYIRNEFTSN